MTFETAKIEIHSTTTSPDQDGHLVGLMADMLAQSVAALLRRDDWTYAMTHITCSSNIVLGGEENAPSRRILGRGTWKRNNIFSLLDSSELPSMV